MRKGGAKVSQLGSGRGPRGEVAAPSLVVTLSHEEPLREFPGLRVAVPHSPPRDCPGWPRLEPPNLALASRRVVQLWSLDINEHRRGIGRGTGFMAKQPATKQGNTAIPTDAEEDELVSYTAVLLTQGKHRFYTLSMPSQILAETCIVEPRAENPIDGFQRLLDKKRAQDIANYIDNGLGTIPGSIVLSAQPEAQLEYIRKARTIRFRKRPGAFLIIDGQHRVFGFKLAKETLRVPVVIYNRLSRPEEARLFMDINTKQRPVPSELILDIKRLAETENDIEALLRDVFDQFNTDGASPLFGLLSPSEKATGKISRVTFNQALKPIWSTVSDSDASSVYTVVSAYLHACLAGLRSQKAESRLTNPTLFKALMLLFPNAAQRVADRFEAAYTTSNFERVLRPLFDNASKANFTKPGASPKTLHDAFRKAMSSGFSLGKSLGA